MITSAQRTKRYRERHPEKVKEMIGAWRSKNRDKVLNYKRADYLKHRAKRRTQQNERAQLLRLEAIAHYSHNKNVCACCGESEIRFLTIDHINGDGAKHRKEYKGLIQSVLKKAGYPNGYQVLCYNCNLGRAHNGGVCPHHQK